MWCPSRFQVWVDQCFFLSYSNDLPAATKCLFDAGTTLLISQLELKLNLELEKIQNWVNASTSTVNYKKSKFVLFSKNSPLTSPFNLSCGGLTIEC